MHTIGIISDTHGYLLPGAAQHFAGCHQIWHAGDFGDDFPITKLKEIAPVHGVFGNIDGAAIRKHFPERLAFELEGLKVCMTHIGGYPGKYTPGIKQWLIGENPDLFICGHSHILKIMPDRALNLLHINPGAAGHHGWHKMMTLVRLQVHHGKITRCEVIELGARGKLST
jgi:putative phosphoesterase